MRPIDADALMEQIRLMVNRTSLGEISLPSIGGLEITGLILNAPTLDVAPVVHGKWGESRIIGFDDSYRAVYGYPCSVCNDCTKVIDSKYCPNCGAKMDGELDYETMG